MRKTVLWCCEFQKADDYNPMVDMSRQRMFNEAYCLSGQKEASGVCNGLRSTK